MKQSAHKIYTDILEDETRTMDAHRKALKKNSDLIISESRFKKLYFQNFGRVSLSTYNKYLRELKEGTYVRCERT